MHLGLVAVGLDAAPTIEEAAGAADCQALLVDAAGGMLWGWFGSPNGGGRDPAEALLGQRWTPGITLAIGEPGEGPAGWRRTHRQARAALAVACAGGGSPVRYRDVALLASALRDELLAASLLELYLEPLEGSREDGETLRRTLRAYFQANRNLSRTGETVGATRQAVARRLQAIETRLGRPISECGPELELALRYEALVGTG